MNNNPNVHIICGFCGKNHGFEYKIVEESKKAEAKTNRVYLICTNCGQYTYLDDIMKEI